MFLRVAGKKFKFQESANWTQNRHMVTSTLFFFWGGGVSVIYNIGTSDK